MAVTAPLSRASTKHRVSSSSKAAKGFIGSHSLLAGTVATAALLGLSAYVNNRLAKKAEADNPPRGRVLEVDGVRLHVYERGQGEPLVLLHGNGTSIEDFASSGLIDMAASRYRVIAFDRPGHGHSTRPRGAAWTDVDQANLIAAALTEMGIPRAVVLGHSWGCTVAVALALNHPVAPHRPGLRILLSRRAGGCGRFFGNAYAGRRRYRAPRHLAAARAGPVAARPSQTFRSRSDPG
jgi:pimeloyl-ACP methyl ester carboxylesterase